MFCFIFFSILTPTYGSLEGQIVDVSKQQKEKIKAIVWIENIKDKSKNTPKIHSMEQLNKKFPPGLIAIRNDDAFIFVN